jgi:hypothetical protein
LKITYTKANENSSPGQKSNKFLSGVAATLLTCSACNFTTAHLAKLTTRWWCACGDIKLLQRAPSPSIHVGAYMCADKKFIGAQG